MNSKLFSASIIVLGMSAFAPAFAFDLDIDNNALALAGNASSADDGGIATSQTDIYAPKSESTTKGSYNTANVDIYAPKSESSSKSSSSNKTVGSFNTKTDNSVDNSKSAKDSFNTKLSSETTNKGSFNTSSKSESSTKTVGSYNSKDDHSVDNSKNAKDSFNTETTNKDSFNTKTSSETTNKGSFNSKDESTHITVGDVALTLSKDTVASKADLTGTVSGAAVAASWGNVSANATMSDSANSNWAGLNQVGIIAGANNSTQMSQQVTAKVGTVNLQ